jgi:UrcA family protein
MKRTATLAVLALLVASPALAAPEGTSVTVRHDDLRLDHPRGQKLLEQRIIRAAREVCGMDDQLTSTRIRPAERVACYHQARATAMERYATVVSDSALGG